MEFLQILLAINVLIVALCLFWIFSLHAKLHEAMIPKKYEIDADISKVFSKEERASIKQGIEAQLEKVVKKSTKELHSSLASATDDISIKTNDMIAGLIGKEVAAYKNDLENIRSQMLGEAKKLQSNIVAQEKQLKSDLKIAIEHDRQVQLDVLDRRLSDIVSSYIIESLDQNVDLGSQMKYIIDSLEANKNEIKKDILS